MTENKIIKRRSALYMPCSNTRALEKAVMLDADVLLFDLEDAVSPDNKQLARENIVQALSQQNFQHRERIVRINGLDSAWGAADCKALKNSEFDGLLLPKAETVEQINEALALIDKVIPIWLMIETPKGVLNSEALARHPAVQVLVMGTNDLAKELRVQQSESREEFLYSFSHCILAARAHGCDIIDGVFNNLEDADGLRSVCEQGKRLGFDGKSLIHPKQLETTNRVFSPSEEEIAHAKAVVAAWQQAEDKGVILVNGKLVEALHVEQAQRILMLSNNP